LYATTANYEAAIDNRITFVQMRDAIAAEGVSDPCVWANPEKVLSILKGVLSDNNTSEAMLNLQVFVCMRATPWLDKNTYIVSPVMQLAQALSVYARLQSAQKTSWEALRAEWVRLLQLKQRFQSKKLSQADAETIVDQARHTALVHHFAQAEQNVKRAMKREAIEAKKVHVLAAREARRLIIAEAKLLAHERKAAKQRWQMWETRRKLLPQSRWKDMTMDDIMLNTYLQL